MRVCLVLVGGDEEGPLRGTGELLRHNARAVVEAGGEVIAAIPGTKTLLGALGEFSSDVVPLASAADARKLGRNVKPIIDSGDFGDASVMLPEAVTGDTIITHVVDPSGVLLIFIQ